MGLHDWVILLVLAALVVYALACVIINAFFRAKRRHRRDVIRELLKGDELS